MPKPEEIAERVRHEEAMEAIAAVCKAWQSGGISFGAAKAVIDDALAGESARIVRVGHVPHSPEIET